MSHIRKQICLKLISECELGIQGRLLLKRLSPSVHVIYTGAVIAEDQCHKTEYELDSQGRLSLRKEINPFMGLIIHRGWNCLVQNCL